MPFQPAPNIARFECRYLEQGQRVENVFHIYKAIPWTPALLLTRCQSFPDWWLANMALYQTHQLSFESVVATDLSSAGAAAVEMPVTGLFTIGQDSDGGAPMNVTVAVKWSTGMGGRSYRGRTFHLGLINNQIEDSRLLEPIRQSLTTAYGLLLEQAVAEDEYFVVLSRWHNGALRAEAIGTEILTCTINGVIDSQRRRLPERGL